MNYINNDLSSVVRVKNRNYLLAKWNHWTQENGYKSWWIIADLETSEEINDEQYTSKALARDGLNRYLETNQVIKLFTVTHFFNNQTKYNYGLYPMTHEEACNLRRAVDMNRPGVTVQVEQLITKNINQSNNHYNRYQVGGLATNSKRIKLCEQLKTNQVQN